MGRFIIPRFMQMTFAEIGTDQFRAAQRLLAQQRYQFPSSWLYSENIDGEWSALSDILERKDSAIQAQVANLQGKIREEDEMVEKRTQDVLADWDKSKPIQVCL
uniref:Tektin n=1 Tax=Syphacia muris TaxID=451379 RepID=A0A0N5ACP6_9BILA